MLPLRRGPIARSYLRTFLLGQLESVKFEVQPASLKAALGDSGLAQMTDVRRLIAQSKDITASWEPPSIRSVLTTDFTRGTIGLLKIAIVPSHMGVPNATMLLETIEYQDPVTGRKLLLRVYALCALLSSTNLPGQLHIPPFFALCDNRDAFCYDLLYEYPGSAGGGREDVLPLTLRDLLTTDNLRGLPSLENRFRLALELAEALSAFHDVDWFHKNLTSFNVLFFTTKNAPTLQKILKPFLFGFQHSRNALDDFTQGPLQDRMHHRYHHPDYISVENHQFKRFVRHFEWYSLGILLLEIGFWAAVDNVMKDFSEDSNEHFAKMILEEKLPLLSFHMGTRYVEVVEYCLTCSPQPTDNILDDQSGALPVLQLNLVFKNRVVYPLQTLVARHTQSEAEKKRKVAGGWDESSKPAKRRTT